jgi:uncharacterized membrane protein YtjA (UPF0391 family)
MRETAGLSERSGQGSPGQDSGESPDGLRLKPGTTEFKPFKESFMLRWVLIFLVVALVASVFGFFGIASAAVGIAKLIFFIAVVGFVITLVMHLLGTRRR